MDNQSSYWVKILVWCIPVIFGAGGVYASFSRTTADVKTIQKEVGSVKQQVSEHEKRGVGHSGTKARLKRIERNQTAIMTRQQAAGENLSAICTKIGADCK